MLIRFVRFWNERLYVLQDQRDGHKCCYWMHAFVVYTSRQSHKLFVYYYRSLRNRLNNKVSFRWIESPLVFVVVADLKTSNSRVRRKYLLIWHDQWHCHMRFHCVFHHLNELDECVLDECSRQSQLALITRRRQRRWLFTSHAAVCRSHGNHSTF